MTLSLIQIAVIMAAFLAGAGGAAYFVRRKNAVQPLPTLEKKEKTLLEDLDLRVHKLEQYKENIDVTLAEMKETVTRGMNRMAARQSKISKKEEEFEMLQELLEQSKETEKDPDLFEQPSNGHKPRIVRNSKRSY